MRLALFVLALLPFVAAAAGAPGWLVLILVISAITIIGTSFLRNPAVFREHTQDTSAMPRDHHESAGPQSTGAKWNGRIEKRVVDNRVFLLGLDNLYRGAMKNHEREELLSCARRVAAALDVGPAQVPVEGYYAGDAQLTEYFRLMRTLQGMKRDAETIVSRLGEYRRLKDVTSSRLYGLPRNGETLFPPPRDALSLALLDTFPDWSVPVLTRAAYDAAIENDDCSLVGLAARAKDPVVIAALRESVVLYAERMVGASLYQPRYVYDWKVDDEVERAARRFIDTFNELFGDELPAPGRPNAELYWLAARDNRVDGRCVAMGTDGLEPPGYYHWAIPVRMQAATAASEVEDFWSPDIWTTERYRRCRGFTGSAVPLK